MSRISGASKPENQKPETKPEPETRNQKPAVLVSGFWFCFGFGFWLLDSIRLKRSNITSA
jgi:hypothetical protein